MNIDKILKITLFLLLFGNTLYSQNADNRKPEETAIIVCDMWDRHWCDAATARVVELAPALDEMLAAAREKGITIVHVPSECMDFYKDFPQRKELQKTLNEGNFREAEIAYDDTKFPNEPA